ncbi:MAG: diaminopimelate decarboxylase [Coriobacteriales bacterium]|jgi:diaminopimelate decarboxylase|nr:diaminopimelate decarboxylase [Coriobacteriales bacterium]
MTHLAHDPQATADQLTTMQLGAVLPQTTQVIDDHLFVGGADTVELAQRFGTALYVMDVAHIKHQLAAYRAALGIGGAAETEAAGETRSAGGEARVEKTEGIKTEGEKLSAQVVYAGKAFLCKALCRLLAEQGCWLDASSGGELAIALAAGFDPTRILAHGNNKTERELTEAIQAGVGLIVADCTEELERIDHLARAFGVRQPILLRIKPGVVAHTHEYIRTGAEDSKFGFGLSDGTARLAVERALASSGIELKGLHAHIGSQIFELGAYRETLDVLAGFMSELHTTLGFTTEVLDLGGGLGIAYEQSDTPASIQELGALLTRHLHLVCQANDLALPTLFVEPGRSIVANAGITLYTVGSIKELRNIRTYVAIDGGMTDNIRCALYGARYEAVIANKAAQQRSRVVTLAGKHCESGDVVALDASLQPPEVGDIIAVLGTGAYCASMSSNYNKQVRPAVVFVEDGRATEVVRRENYADLLACDVG